MTTAEIKGFATKTTLDHAFVGKTVLVRAPADKGGKYIGRAGKFDAVREDACRFDYDRDDVGGQVAACDAAGMPILVELAD
jgi:hypothetical protein